MKKIAIMFGGISPEHEVSVITGLQVFQNIDRNVFDPYLIEIDKKGFFKYHKGVNAKKDFYKNKPHNIIIARDTNGVYFHTGSLLGEKVYVDAAYLAFHGGNGESGQIQGFLEILDLPYTSSSVESSSIAMNKVLAKEVLIANNIKTIKYARLFSYEIDESLEQSIRKIEAILNLPVIIKPAHLGSSIGINIARTKVDLKKYLLEAAQLDAEILIEQLLVNFKEYNVSVRKVDKTIEISEVEEPISVDEILSFADKYQRGSKKMGGMSSLARNLPAVISPTLKAEIHKVAKQVFHSTRSSGLVRIDFMYDSSKLYVTEVNPIPGSMSYYLWEAKGIPFKRQITELLNNAFQDHTYSKSKSLEYKTDIVEKFINSKDH